MHVQQRQPQQELCIYLMPGYSPSMHVLTCTLCADFHKASEHTFATSCTDGTVCVWDLRHMGASTGKAAKSCKALATLQHKKACHGA